MYSTWRAVAVCAMEYMQIRYHWHLSQKVSEQAGISDPQDAAVYCLSEHASLAQQYLTNADALSAAERLAVTVVCNHRPIVQLPFQR